MVRADNFRAMLIGDLRRHRKQKRALMHRMIKHMDSPQTHPKLARAEQVEIDVEKRRLLDSERVLLRVMRERGYRGI